MSIKIGIAPIAWTNDDMPKLGKENTFKQCISEMALAGYKGCEIGNKFPKDVDELKRQLDIRGLQVCNAWFSTYLTTKRYNETEKAFISHCEKLYRLGAKVVGVSEQGHSIQGINLPVFKAKYSFSDVEWNLLTAGLDKLGKLSKEKFDIDLVYHHHVGTGVQTLQEVDRLMQNTDSAFVGLLYDSGHFAYSGEDPFQVAEKYVDRIRHVHLKDIRFSVIDSVKLKDESFLSGVKQGTFTVPGDGDIDFQPIIKLFCDAGYNGWMVVEAEQDPSIADPYEYAVKAMTYLRKYITE